MCFPGDEIPEWFNFQCEGSLINMNLDEGWCNDNFKGFALCVVFSRKARSYYEEADLICEMCFKTEDGEPHTKTQWCIKRHMGADKCHVVLRFSIDVDYNDVSSAVHVSFEFQSERNVENYDVKRCGIRMLYINDADKCQVSRSPYQLQSNGVKVRFCSSHCF